MDQRVLPAPRLDPRRRRPDVAAPQRVAHQVRRRRALRDQARPWRQQATPRKFDRIWGDEEPTVDGTAIPVWIRDEWNVTESKAKDAAARAGNDSPIVFVLLPKVDAEAIRDSLAGYAAALDTVNQRPEPQTDEGRQAKRGMQSRVAEGEQRLQSLFSVVIAKARVFQGGGNELTTSSLRDGVETAGRHALARQFPKFAAADNPSWGKVIARARDGAADGLAAVGWTGEVPANPVCKEALARVSGAGTKGSDVQRQLGDPPYGWPKDAIDGALLALLASGNVRAEREGQKIAGPKELPATQIGKATFYKEDEPPALKERIAVKGFSPRHRSRSRPTRRARRSAACCNISPTSPLGPVASSAATERLTQPPRRAQFACGEPAVPRRCSRPNSCARTSVNGRPSRSTRPT